MANYSNFGSEKILGSWDVLHDDDYKKMLNMKLLKEINAYIEIDTYEELADITDFIMAIYEFKDIYVHEIDDINSMKPETHLSQ